MGQPAFKYKFDGSVTNQNTDAACTGTHVGFYTTTPAGFTPETDNEYVDTAESGRSTFLAERAPVEISKRWGPKTLSFQGSHDVLTYFSYWASHGDAAATAAQVSASAFYMNSWTDDTVGSSPRAFTARDLAYPGTSDDNNNVTVRNCVLTNCTITGARDQLVGCTATVLGGGYTQAAGTNSDASARSNIFSFMHCGLFTSDTVGTSVVGTPFTDATIETADAGLVAGTVADWSDDWHGFTLSIDTNYNLPESLVPGGSGYVEKAADWIIDGHALTLTLRMRQGATNTNTLLSEYQAKTVRPFSILMKHPTALTTNVYAGFRVALGACYPVPGSYSEEVLGDMGQRIVTIQYRPHYSASNYVRFAGVLGQVSTALGTNDV